VKIDVADVQHVEDERVTAKPRLLVSPAVSGGDAAPAPAEDQYRINNDFKSEEGEGTLDVHVGDIVIVGEKVRRLCCV
jgi:hypothetical protein